MRAFSCILTVCLVGMVLVVTADAQEVRHAPFTIPPNGKPELLVGEVGFEAPTALGFDAANRPYMFNACEPEFFGYILTLREAKWIRLSYLDALRKIYPDMQLPRERFGHATGSIAVDNHDGLYAVVRVRKNAKEFAHVLLFSPDLGEHFEAHELPGMAFLEGWTGHNSANQPPAIGYVVRRKAGPGKWADYHDLLVFLSKREGDRLILGDPVEVSTNCFGIALHSGGYSFAVTTGSKCHVVYADIPEDNKGNPTYAATLDRKERRVIARQFLVNAPPGVPDVHSTPVIAADSTGRLHVLAGAHGQSFYYTRSMKPDTVEGGWTTPRAMGRGQTYATLVCDSRDRLHSVYRFHPPFRLLYQHKPAGAETWSKPAALVLPPEGHEGYGVYYHRLFMDRADALYLSFTFFEFNTGGKVRYPRVLAISDDNGQSWRLATTATMQTRVITQKKGEPAHPGDAAGPRP